MEENIFFRTYRAAVIILLVCMTHVSYCQNGDIRLLRSINGQRTAGLDGVMNGLTQSAYPLSAAVPAAQLVYSLCKRDTPTFRNAVQTTAGLVVTIGITYGLKYAVNRQRPYITYTGIRPYSYDTDPSFPSGHTSMAFSTATALSLEYPKWYVIAPSFLWAGAVGYSRLYLGMHYPTDVLAGAIVGAGSSWLSYEGMRWLRHRNKKKTL